MESSVGLYDKAWKQANIHDMSLLNYGFNK